MARLLAERDSTSLHLTGARRHQSLARRYRREVIAGAIEPLIAALKGKSEAAEERTLEAQVAYDEVIAADADQDDAVRNLFDAGKLYDRANPAAAVLPDLFPDGGFSEINREPLAKQPQSVEALATRMDSLGAAHPLAAHSALLRSAAAAVRAALAKHDDAIRVQKSAEAEEAIAKSALRRQFEGNYLDARRQWGRVFADRLFPRLQSVKRSKTGESDTAGAVSKTA